MKVLLLFTGSNIGGAERSLTRMVAKARELGGDVEYRLATLAGPGPWVEWADSMGLSPVAFGSEGAGESGKLSFSCLRSALRFAKSNGIDALYVMGLRAAFAIRLLRLVSSCPKLVHGIRANPSSRTKLDIAFRMVERISNRLIDMYIANSAAAAITMEACGVPKRKIRVIHNGLERLPDECFAWTSRPEQVAVVANIQPRKGHLELIPAVTELSRCFPGLRFVFLGRDDCGGAVQAAYGANGLASVTNFVGFQADVGQWLRDSRLFLFPPHGKEGAPTAILEAMAWGVPVVAYAIDGVPELVRDGVDGRLVQKIGDTSALAGAAAEILTSPETAAAMGAAGRERVAMDFTLESCVRKHEAAFMGL